MLRLERKDFERVVDFQQRYVFGIDKTLVNSVVSGLEIEVRTSSVAMTLRKQWVCRTGQDTLCGQLYETRYNHLQVADETTAYDVFAAIEQNSGLRATMGGMGSSCEVFAVIRQNFCRCATKSV